MDPGLDLYAETDDNFDENYGGNDMMGDGLDNSVDLYGDMGGDTGGSQSPTKVGMETDYVPEEEHHTASQGSSTAGRRYTLIVGNLTWWTTDDDLQEMFDSFGVQDIYEIRIHENRSNGQSKGFAIVIVGSEETSRFLQSEMPKRELHGQCPACVPFSRQALQNFDAVAKKNEGIGRNQGQNNFNNNQNNRMDQGPNRMPMNNPMMANRMRMPPRPPFPMMGRFPPMPGMRPMGPFGMRPPVMPMGAPWDPAVAAAAAMGLPPGMRMQMGNPMMPAPHVNPAFFGQMGGASPGAGSEMAVDSTPPQSTLQPGTEDYENVVAQMKQIASNALTRAATECKTDAPEALNKLRAALAIVESSKVADDERVQRQIKSLQEAMEDLGGRPTEEGRRNGHSRSRERSREREKDRESSRNRHRDSDRERDPRRRRSRTRSRSRERRRSSDRERRRDRERERDRERRDRESSRDRDRDRRR